jgi:SAM-dependent methyltransferase
MSAGYHDLNALEPAAGCLNQMPESIEAKVGSVFDDLFGVFHKKFDLIILSHVIEHIYDLRHAILNVIGILKPEGKIYLEAPDASRYCEYLKVPFYYFDAEHINHFEQSSLKRLMGMFGFDAVSVVLKDISVSEDELYPAVGGLFSRVDAVNGIRTYIQDSGRGSELSAIDEWIESGESVVVWGAGSYTKRLLATTNLGQCKIAFFVDTDSLKQGKKIGEYFIRSPKEVQGFAGPILVASALFSDEITRQIKGLGLVNKVIVLK